MIQVYFFLKPFKLQKTKIYNIFSKDNQFVPITIVSSVFIELKK